MAASITIPIQTTIQRRLERDRDHLLGFVQTIIKIIEVEFFPSFAVHEPETEDTDQANRRCMLNARVLQCDVTAKNLGAIEFGLLQVKIIIMIQCYHH